MKRVGLLLVLAAALLSGCYQFDPNPWAAKVCAPHGGVKRVKFDRGDPVFGDSGVAYCRDTSEFTR